MTRVPELMSAGVNVAFGHDCVMDPWYALGQGDMLEVPHMAVHVAPMTSRGALRAVFDAVTVSSAKAIGLAEYGLAVGCDASFVLLQAVDPIEAIRMKAHRLLVVRKGLVLARSEPRLTRLTLPGRESVLDPASYAPAAAN